MSQKTLPDICMADIHMNVKYLSSHIYLFEYNTLEQPNNKVNLFMI